MGEEETVGTMSDVDDITAEELPGLTRELLDAAGIEPKEGENALDLTLRTADRYALREGKPPKVPEDKWLSLSGKAQRLINSVILSISEKEEDPELLLALDAPSDEDQEDSSSEEGDTGMSVSEETATATETNSRRPPKAVKAKGAEKAPKAAKAEKGSSKEAKAAPKEAKGKKAAPKANGRERFTSEQKVKVLKKENPYREGSKRHGFWKYLKTGQTVAQTLATGHINRGDLGHAVDDGHIEIK